MKQLQIINTNSQSKIFELTEEIVELIFIYFHLNFFYFIQNKSQQIIETLTIENNTKNQQIDNLQKRIDSLVLKIVRIKIISILFTSSLFFRMQIKMKFIIYKNQIKLYKFELMK